MFCFKDTFKLSPVFIYKMVCAYTFSNSLRRGENIFCRCASFFLHFWEEIKYWMLLNENKSNKKLQSEMVNIPYSIRISSIFIYFYIFCNHFIISNSHRTKTCLTDLWSNMHTIGKQRICTSGGKIKQCKYSLYIKYILSTQKDINASFCHINEAI